MIITLVTDQFYRNGNGTCISAQNLSKGLTERGHTIRVLSVDDGSHTPYALKERNFGAGINKIIHSQGMQLTKPDNKIILQAITGADVVHVLTPFKLGQKNNRSMQEKWHSMHCCFTYNTRKYYFDIASKQMGHCK